MMRKWLLPVLAIILALLPISVAAEDTIVVAQPDVGAGILTFTATIVTNTQVDLEWTKAVGIANVMVRAKYGDMPIDRTDGYLVYQGALDSASDTSMNFDEATATLYYRIWGQNEAGIWVESQIMTQNLIGGSMTLLAYFLGVAILSFIAVRSDFVLLKIAGMGGWLFMFMYIKSHPPLPLVEGSPEQQVLLIVCLAAGLGIGLMAFGRSVGRSRMNNGGGASTTSWKWNFGSDRQELEGRAIKQSETLDEYQTKVRNALRRR